MDNNAFCFTLRFYYTDGQSDEFHLQADSDYYYEEPDLYDYAHVSVSVDPKDLGTAKDIPEMIQLLKDNIIGDNGSVFNDPKRKGDAFDIRKVIEILEDKDINEIESIYMDFSPYVVDILNLNVGTTDIRKNLS